MAAADPRIVGITPAMREGSGLVEFSKHFPERYFDVAIAEQHAVTFAAGLAVRRPEAGGGDLFDLPAARLRPADPRRGAAEPAGGVRLDRAGLVGSDGATHQGSYDLSFLRCIPNTVIMAPADENECRQMLYTGSTLDCPAIVRYPRGSGPGVASAAR